MSEVLAYLQQGAQGDLLPWSVQQNAAQRFGLDCAAVEMLALENDLLPARYQRNRKMLSTRQQLQLFRSTVAVLGCGGLGGYILEELARLGVGHIIAVDPDIFEEHNLNRQLLSTPDTLNAAKAPSAAQRLAQVNPAVRVSALKEAFGATNGSRLLGEADLALDALDTLTVRRELIETCRELDISLVHGAIAGWYGNVTTIFPGDEGLDKLYGVSKEAKGVEQELGNPSFTPAVVASLQVAEACKVLLGLGEPLRRRAVAVDLLDMEFTELDLGD